jgi:hypothetical protein
MRIKPVCADESCGSDRTRWQDRPVPHRDWVRTSCRECGRFIGYRPNNLDAYYKKHTTKKKREVNDS